MCIQYRARLPSHNAPSVLRQMPNAHHEARKLSSNYRDPLKWKGKAIAEVKRLNGSVVL